MKNPKESFWKEKFHERGAYWKHDDNPFRPHALLTTGLHSIGFVNGSFVIEDPCLLEEACNDLRIGQSFPVEGKLRFVGSANGATTIPHELAKRLGAKTGFTEKVLKPVTLGLAFKTFFKCLIATLQGKEYHFEGESEMTLKRFNVRGQIVIPCEDVLTTGKTTRRTIQVLEENGAKVYHKIYVLFNRSGMTHLDGREIVALVDEEMPMHQPGACPTCNMGSVAVRPKGNWDALNAVY